MLRYYSHAFTHCTLHTRALRHWQRTRGNSYRPTSNNYHTARDKLWWDLSCYRVPAKLAGWPVSSAHIPSAFDILIKMPTCLLHRTTVYRLSEYRLTYRYVKVVFACPRFVLLRFSRDTGYSFFERGKSSSFSKKNFRKIPVLIVFPAGTAWFIGSLVSV